MKPPMVRRTAQGRNLTNCEDYHHSQYSGTSIRRAGNQKSVQVNSERSLLCERVKSVVMSVLLCIYSVGTS